MITALFLACAPDALDVTVDGDHAATTKAITEGSPEAIALLAFLNDASTTYTVLDDDVPLDKRAASGLIHHRDGYDGVAGTSDDDLFDSVAEIDAVKWVGGRSIDKLSTYAHAHGWGLGDSDELGTWDGVTFTVAEANATVAFVNDASETMLDDEVPLNRRAVDSILAARPLDSVQELSELYFIGNSAMTLLLDGAYNLGDDTWLDEDSDEQATCDGPAVSQVSHSDADDLTELLALSTTSDWAWGDIKAYESTGCSDWETPDESFTHAAFEATFWWSWSEIESYVELGEWTPGADSFADVLNTALVVIEERIDDGDWDPSEAQDLYDSRDALVDGLLSDVSEYPHGYMEQTIYVDLSECSQSAVLLLDVENGDLLVAHENPGC